MLPQNIQKQTDITPHLANPFQLEVARALSKDLQRQQKNQLLTADILNKIGDLSKLESRYYCEISKGSGAKKIYFSLKTFTLVAAERIK